MTGMYGPPHLKAAVTFVFLLGVNQIAIGSKQKLQISELPRDAVYFQCAVEGQLTNKALVPSPPSRTSTIIIMSKGVGKIWQYHRGDDLHDSLPESYKSDGDYTIYETVATPGESKLKFVFNHAAKRIQALTYAANDSTKVIHTQSGLCKEISNDALRDSLPVASIATINPERLPKGAIGLVCQGHYEDNSNKTQFLDVRFLVFPMRKSVFLFQFDKGFSKPPGHWVVRDEDIDGVHFTVAPPKTLEVKTFIDRKSGAYKMSLRNLVSDSFTSSRVVSESVVVGDCRETTSLSM